MNRSWVRFPQAAQRRPPGNGWAFLYARVVFRAPSGSSVGPGCLVCPWAAARPRDRHTRACGSEWSISKPGQAPPPPTGTAAGLALRPLRCPPHQWGVVCCVWWRVDSKPGQASPRPRAPQPGPGLLYVAQRWLSIINFACNSPVACSNIEFASLELQRFLGLLKFGPIELHAKFIWS